MNPWYIVILAIVIQPLVWLGVGLIITLVSGRTVDDD